MTLYHETSKDTDSSQQTPETPSGTLKNGISEETARVVSKCRCSGCGCYFSSDYIFERHRITDSGKRRCLTDPEMRAIGLADELRMVRRRVNDHPTRELEVVWYDAIGREKMRELFKDKR